MLLAELAENAMDLVESPYGNYAVQHALEEWGWAICLPIFKSLEGHMTQLSIQKFSSNVVEKILCVAPADFRKQFIGELLDCDKITALLNSNYGHYVVKRALQLADASQVKSLLDTLRSNVTQLSSRRLRVKWEKVLSAGDERLGVERGVGGGVSVAAVAPVTEVPSTPSAA